jgi:hypothetical protein
MFETLTFILRKENRWSLSENIWPTERRNNRMSGPQRGGITEYLAHREEE